MLSEEVVAAGAVLPLRAGDGPPSHGDRGHDDHRGLDAELDDVVRLEDRYGREGTSTA